MKLLPQFALNKPKWEERTLIGKYINHDGKVIEIRAMTPEDHWNEQQSFIKLGNLNIKYINIGKSF